MFDYPNPKLATSSILINANETDKYVYVKSKNKNDFDKSATLIYENLFNDVEQVLKNIDNLKTQIDANKSITPDANTLVDSNIVDSNVIVDANTIDSNN